MTLYGIIREMLARGDLTTRPSNHVQMGAGKPLFIAALPFVFLLR